MHFYTHYRSHTYIMKMKMKMKMKTQELVFSLLLILCFAAAPAQSKSSPYHSKTKPSKPRAEKVTSLKFYLHDTLSGPGPTAVRVARNERNDTGPLSFGSVYAINDPMTAGPGLNSTRVGNARGMYLSGSGDDLTLVMYADFGFTAGRFNGSSFSVFSRNPVSAETVREVAVVGGRGRFRMARGFGKVTSYSIDMVTGDAILLYKVTLYHY